MEPLSKNRPAAFAALLDEQRAALYRFIARTDAAVTREQAAAELGVPRSTAAFHLDRLAAAGLLTVEYRRLSGRSGPGAGRPSKLYRAVASDVSASLPERHYELAGELLASAIERAEREQTSIRDALDAEARTLGATLGASGSPPTLEGALVRCGYAPADDGNGGVALDNCPFHMLASAHTGLICDANLALVEGLVAATADRHVPALTSPTNGGCCVVLHAPADT